MHYDSLLLIAGYAIHIFIEAFVVSNVLAYLGMNVPHWRSPLRTHPNDRFMQLFLHFVRKNGQYADYAFDRNDKCYELLKK